MSGILPRIVYPGTVEQAASDLLTAVQGTDVSVQACTTVDASVKQTWSAWAADVTAWLTNETTSPSIWGLGSQMDQIETYAQELLRWQKTINGFCDNVVSPVIDPNQIPASQEWWKGALEWTVVGVVAVSVAYGVGQIVMLIPKPAPSEPRRSSLLERAKTRARSLRASYG